MLQYRHRCTPDLDKLWVITVVSNPQRYKSRYELYHRFKVGVERVGANLITVELALGDRCFELTDRDNPRHVQLRTMDELWHKENMQNLGAERVPPDCKYLMFCDADIEFVRHDWPEEVVQQLQHYKVVQPFQSVIDLGPNGEALKIMDGFVYSWVNNAPAPFSYGGSGPFWHPGFSTAYRIDSFSDLGGLVDWAILGSADFHMWWALIGKTREKLASKVSSAYRKHLLIWEDRALSAIRKNIGYMPGTIYHHWHGKKVNRRYEDRYQILYRHNYDPELDIQDDWQGLKRFSNRGDRMRNDIRAYFAQRNEDDITL